MANEITIAGKLLAAKLTAGINGGLAPGSILVTMTGANVSEGTMDVATGSWQLVPKGSIGTIGICMFWNTGTTVIDLQNGNGGSANLSIKPGEICGPVRLKSAGAWYAEALVGAGTMIYYLAED